MSLEEELKQLKQNHTPYGQALIDEALKLLRVHTKKICSWKKFTKVTDKLGKSKLNPEWMKGYSCGYKNAIDQVLAELVMDSGMKETLEIMKDKKLMKKIREVRKKGSKSSPYKPLEVGDKK